MAPDSLEDTGPTGMVLASVLGVQFDAKPGNDDLKELCACVDSNIHRVLPPELMTTLVAVVLKFVVYTAFPITRD